MTLVARKAKSAGKSAFKNFKKAVGIPTGPLTEANPRYYMVISSQGALVRNQMELDSPQVYNLRFGDVVTVAEIDGRRARLIDPVEGWVSLTTSDNECIFELTFPPDKRTQVRTMERRFEKLKQEQAAMRGCDLSPIAVPTVHRTTDSDQSEEDPSKTTVSNLKSKIVFKSKLESENKPVPALKPLGKPAAATLVAAPVSSEDLLDFGSPQKPLSSSGISTPEVVIETSFSLL